MEGWVSDVLEYFVDHFGLSDIGDDAQLTSTEGAGCDVDLKYTFEPIRPGKGSDGSIDVVRIGLTGWGLLGFLRCRC